MRNNILSVTYVHFLWR